MDRKYLDRHTVRVYLSQKEKDAGISCNTLHNVEQWPFCGCVNYMATGVMYPGFIDPHEPPVDACIILTKRHFN